MTLRLGDIAPNFQQQSQLGSIDLYQYLGNQWGVLFSHPADFTPVCTTELGAVARLEAEFAERNAKVIALSVDSAESHSRWIPDIDEVGSTKVQYPILADEDRSVAQLYDMIHPEADNTLTVRSVFIIDPAKKIRMILTYPASTGRNFQEILRVLDSLQLTDHHSVATPVDWKHGEEVVIVPSLTDEAVMKEKFPKGWKEIRPYLRMTPDPKS